MLGCLVQKLPWHGRVAATKWRPWAGAVEHVAEELGDLLALDGFGLGVVLLGFGFFAQLDLLSLRSRRAQRLPAAHENSKHQRRRDRGNGGEGQLVPANEFPKAVEAARWTCHDRF